MILFMQKESDRSVRKNIWEPQPSKLLNNVANLYSNLFTNMHVLLINKLG